jgi:hypothetical protein
MSKKSSSPKSFIQCSYNGIFKKSIVRIDFSNESLKNNTADLQENYGSDVFIKEYIIPDRNKEATQSRFNEEIINSHTDKKMNDKLYKFTTKEFDELIKSIYSIKRGKFIYKKEKEAKDESTESETEKVAVEEEKPKKAVAKKNTKKSDDESDKEVKVKKTTKKEAKAVVEKKDSSSESEEEKPKKAVSAKKAPVKTEAKAVVEKNDSSSDSSEDEKPKKAVPAKKAPAKKVEAVVKPVAIKVEDSDSDSDSN